MRAGILCLLLLSACIDQIEDKLNYDYGLTWVCLSPEGCERAEALRLFNRLIVHGDSFVFLGTSDPSVYQRAQRFGSESLPAGCWWLHAFSVFGQELEPSKLCSVSGGFDLELSIPDRNPATHSQWLVKARELELI